MVWLYSLLLQSCHETGAPRPLVGLSLALTTALAVGDDVDLYFADLACMHLLCSDY